MNSINSLETLAVIPARGGSKGIPRKNIRLLAGKPLIAYTIAAVLNAKKITEHVISTDDQEIAQIAKDFGGNVPFLRPAYLATDIARNPDTVKDALEKMEEKKGKKYDIVINLQPTTPFRTSRDIDEVISIFEKKNVDSVISLSTPIQDNPYYAYEIHDGKPIEMLDTTGKSRRQELPEVYIRNGAIYAVLRDYFTEKGSYYGDRLYSYIMPKERSINIDEPFDLEIAECLIKKGLVDVP